MNDWAFFSKRIIPDIFNPERDYLTRLEIIKTPWFGIYYHEIHLPDSDRNLHDHPWPFVAFILSGAYTEETPEGERLIKFFNRKKVGDYHRVKQLHGTVKTLIIRGPKVEEWGYLSEQGKVHHETYHQEHWVKINATV